MSTKKIIALICTIVLLVIFVVFNIVHIAFPVDLIIEDIKAGTVHGTNLELAALFPWIIEFASIPFVLLELIYIGVFWKEKIMKIPNLIVFGLFALQVALFNILLWL